MDMPDDIPERALAWHREGRGAALATVMETWGSAPRRPGAMLAVSGDGEMMGSVSGGCVEGAVVVAAIDAIASGRPEVLEFGVADEEAFAVGLACGGTIRVLVEPVAAIGEGRLEQIADARRKRRSIGYRVNLTSWEREVIEPSDAPERFGSDRSGLDGDVLTVIHAAPLRLVIVGGVHIAQALVPMAQLAGFDPVVVDPREAFASSARFTGAALRTGWPDEEMDALAPDARTAIVTLTHDPKLDDPALRVALRSNAFYIGALGSTRTHAKRLSRLEKLGLTDQVTRISAPIGLSIGAASPAEIAVSILAEIIAALRGRDARAAPLAGRAAPGPAMGSAAA